MGQVPYVRWWIDDWVAGTAYMTRTERAGYHDLLMCQAVRGSGFTLELAHQILGTDFTATWDNISSKFTEKNGVFFNAKMAFELERQRAYSKSRASNRSKTKQLKQKHMSNTCKTYEEHMGTGTGTNASSDASSGTGSSRPAKPEWKASLEIYLAEELAAYNALLCDAEWISAREKYHPGLNVLLSVEKAHIDFWGTEAGWRHRKGKRGNTIDWKRTFSNAITQPTNKVWLPRQQQNDIPADAFDPNRLPEVPEEV